ncbi:MAG TPA: hypothetical protein VGC55_15765, partial [Dokdonella sp.]
EQPRFDGSVVVDWLDAKGTRLSSANYRTRETRFRLAVPAAARGKFAQVRVYAASLASGRDAIGGIDVLAQPSRPDKPLRVALADWWHALTAPPYRAPVRHADTIAILDFETPPPAQLAQQTGAPAPAAAAASGVR